MPLKVDDLKIKGRLPELPRSIPLLSVRVPSLEERQWAIDMIVRRLELGKVKSAEIPHGYVFASRLGEVEFFRASGAIWASDTTADEKFKSEARPWRGVQKKGTGRTEAFTLGRETSTKLAEASLELLKETGLLREEVSRPTIKLDRWAQLDAKGREIKSGAGTATVQLSYKVEGIAAIGPGAKTLLFAEPENGLPKISGMFHVWRDVTGASELRLPSIESALGVGLLQDPELTSYKKRGHHIEIDRISFGFLALPAFVHQSYLFPAFAVEGTVRSREDKLRSFSFGKYYHAAAPKQYAKVGVAASYLMTAL